MATVARRYSDHPGEDPSLQELHSGDCMRREEFHRIYEQMPEDFKAELVGGTVYVASPLKQHHAEYHARLALLFGMYAAAAPGLQVCDNATVILSEDDELQPDLLLRIRPEYGGQSQNTEDHYIQGAPELIAEVAHSSRSIDLNSKEDRYCKAGVREYLILCLFPREVVWFDLARDTSLTDSDGVFQSKIFPGLWIDSQALIDLDYQRSSSVLTEGLQTSEHKDFLSHLTESI